MIPRDGILYVGFDVIFRRGIEWSHSIYNARKLWPLLELQTKKLNECSLARACKICFNCLHTQILESGHF